MMGKTNLLLALFGIGLALALPQYDDYGGDGGEGDGGSSTGSSTTGGSSAGGSTTGGSTTGGSATGGSSTGGSTNTTGGSTTTGGSCSCGKKKAGTRVVGGTNAAVNEYPWMVAIKNKDDGQFCGAAIINSRWIVTAAHCIADMTTFKVKTPYPYVTVGEHNLKSTTETKLTKDFAIEKIVPHSNFKKGVKYYTDLALIKVKKPIDINTYTPICLPKPGFDIRGKKVTLAGWGTTVCVADKWGDCLLGLGSKKGVILQELVNAPAVSNIVCKKSYNKGGATGDPKKQHIFCYGGEKGKSGCSGDSGSGIVYNDNGKYTLVGAVSSGTGVGCGAAGTYGTAVEISSYIPWIKKTATGGKSCSG